MRYYKRVKSYDVILVITGLLIPFFTYSNTSYAQEQSISIYPPVIEVQTTPPSSPSVPIIIQNNTDTDVSLKIDLVPIKQNGATGIVNLDESLSDKGFYKYYEERTQFLLDDKKVITLDLQPLESREIALNINLSKGDPPGDYYYAVTFLSSGKSLNDASTSRIPNGLATNLLLSIGPKTKSTGGVSEFKTKSFVTHGPVPFELKLHNSSTHLISPTGNVEITNIFGQKVGKLEILPQYILSGSDRYLVDTLQASSEARLAYNETDNTPRVVWQDQFLLGLYKAKASIMLDEKGPKIEAITYFIAFPLYFFIPIVVVIFIGVGIYLRVKRKL